jgi:hypothetical protein
MSLHKFAEQVASQGRGDDSLLVHMTPDEVRNLQKFAEANGTTLTINPETGLPEAGLLSDLFKAVAPIALGAFLGPAGLGMSSMMAGVATGGITTLATGSLSRGLMAGLGAYGGAGLGASLAGASGMTGGAALGAGIPGDMAFNLADAGVAEAGIQSNVGAASKAIADVQPSLFDKLGAGAKAVTSSPTAALDFAKGNLGNLGFAAAPLLAMQPTTKMPEPKDTGYIRQMAYNINPDTGRPDPLYGKREMTPIKASEFGNKTFQGQRDLFYQQNPNPYDIGIGSLNQPPQQQQTTPMASGGIVALASGGGWDYSKFDPKNYVSTAKVNTQAEVDAANAANPFSAQNMAKVDVTRPGQYVNDASGNPVALSAGVAGFDANNPTALTHLGELASRGGQNTTVEAFNQIATPEQKAKAADLWTKEKARLDAIDRAAGRLPADNTGLANLNQNQNLLVNQNQNQNVNAGLTNLIPDGASYTNRFFAERGMGFDPVDRAIDGFLDTYKAELAAMTPAQQEAAMRGALDKERMNEADVIKATGKTIAQLVQAKRADGSIIVPGNLNEVPVGSLPGGVSGAGNTVVNANGTITTKPDFSLTMNDVRNAYTKGGGSLGYTAPVVKTPAEHEAAYNKLTDDSLDAYNFLMGKGKNLTQRKAETRDRPVMARYDEAVLGKKAVPRAARTTTTTIKGVPGKPQSFFDEKAYLAANPDVEAELKTGKSVSGEPTRFTSGYEHYLLYGKTGGRAFTGDYEGYLTAAALADAVNASGGGDASDGGGGGGGDGGGGGGGGNAAGAASAAGGGNAATGTGNAATAADAATAATAAASVGVGDADASGGRRGGRVTGYAMGGGLGSLGSYSDGGRLLKGPGDGVSDSIPATIGRKRQPARLADGEFVIPARIVSELGNGSTEAGAKKLYAMMDRVQRARGKTTGKNKVAANSRADKYLPA